VKARANESIEPALSEVERDVDRTKTPLLEDKAGALFVSIIAANGTRRWLTDESKLIKIVSHDVSSAFIR